MLFTALDLACITSHIHNWVLFVLWHTVGIHLKVVKLEMAKVNINILGIGELKWNGMGELNSDDHCIYYCGLEFLRGNGIAIKVSKRV